MWSAGFLPFIERQTEGHNGCVVLLSSTVCAISLKRRCELAVIPLLLTVQVPQTNQPQHWGMQSIESWWKTCFLLWPTYCIAAVGQFKSSYIETEHNAWISVMMDSMMSGFSNMLASAITFYCAYAILTAKTTMKSKKKNKKSFPFSRKCTHKI